MANLYRFFEWADSVSSHSKEFVFIWSAIYAVTIALRAVVFYTLGV